MSESYTLYNKTVMDHFMNPRNMGDIKDADAVGEVGAAACGDIMKISLKIDDITGTVMDARFKTFGCGSAIAASSMATELIKGKSIDELERCFSNDDIVNALGGFKTMDNLGIIQLRIIPAVGAEQFAKYIYEKLNTFIQEETEGRVKIAKVEFMEHAKNTAIYEN